MVIVFSLLFLLGFYLFGLAFNIPEWGGLIFAAGILSVTLALAIPVHFARK
ncbi:hypothetical protein [Microbacterium sp.]|uniref:hypothetical protein n=1 Tax=Microbacterium sp. TaxID=51671 RepID=UPI003A896578